MLQLPDPLVLHLQDGELLPVDGVRLRVEAGRVWVTRRDDLDDHFLDAGAVIDLARGCGALVGAEGPARVWLSGAAQPSARPLRSRLSTSLGGGRCTQRPEANSQPRQVNGNASWRQNPLGT